MDWFTFAKFAIPVLIVILAVHGTLSLLSGRIEKRPALRTFALTYSPGEGMWLLIWAAITAGLWAWFFV